MACASSISPIGSTRYEFRFRKEYRTSFGNPCIRRRGPHSVPAAGATIASDCFRALKRVAKVLPWISSKTVVYGGVARQFRRDAEVVPLADLPKVLERYDGRQGT